MVGLINLDKPAGISSAGALNRIKRLLPRGTKLGHAGTLDPFATGVLVVLVGKATRLCEQIMGMPKGYEATICLGASTPTLDLDSPVTPGPQAREVSAEELAAVLGRFVGTIQQMPPVYSALKVAGRRAYDLARAGETVELAPRTVQVYGIDLISFDRPLLRLRVDCGRGFYVRSLARDIAAALGTTGYLTQLRRTRVGEMRIEEAVGLEKLMEEGAERHLRGMPG